MPDGTITYRYVFDPDYNPKYVNGAYGGHSPRQEIIINFYMERNPVPIRQIHEVLEGGKLGKVTASDPDDLSQKMVRFVQCGVVMNLETANLVHTWLGNHIKAIDAERKGKNGN